MRVTLSDARESPIAAAVLLLGIAATAAAFALGDGEFGAPTGSPLFLLGAGFTAVAIGLTLVHRLGS